MHCIHYFKFDYQWSTCMKYIFWLFLYTLFLGSQGKPLQTVEAYDWVGDTWSEIKACPTTHCSCAFTMHDDRLLVIGGLSMAGPSSSMEALSFKPDKWPVCLLVCFYYNSMFFILFFNYPSLVAMPALFIFLPSRCDNLNKLIAWRSKNLDPNIIIWSFMMQLNCLYELFLKQCSTCTCILKSFAC